MNCIIIIIRKIIIVDGGGSGMSGWGCRCGLVVLLGRVGRILLFFKVKKKGKRRISKSI